MPSFDGMTAPGNEKGMSGAFDILRDRGWFAQLRDGTQRSIEAAADIRRICTGEAVYNAGDAATGLFGLVDGSLDVSTPRDDGFDTPVLRLETGAWFGAPAILSGQPRNMSVTAVMPATLVFVPNRAITSMVQDDPVVFQELFALIHSSFTLTLRLLANSLMLDSCKRVGLRLLLQYGQAGDPDSGITLSQNDLAAFCGISVATVERALKKLTSEGIVQTGYGRILVPDRERLLTFCAA